MIKTSRLVTSHKSVDELMGSIRSVLSPDLLKPEYLDKNKDNPTFGHCYAATEALYHLLGGKDSGWVPMRGKDATGVTHWWLRGPDGQIVDPTADQYTSQRKSPPYEGGRGGGFLTSKPSLRAQKIIDRLKK